MANQNLIKNTGDCTQSNDDSTLKIVKYLYKRIENETNISASLTTCNCFNLSLVVFVTLKDKLIYFPLCFYAVNISKSQGKIAR